jgi:hypothetical protein
MYHRSQTSRAKPMSPSELRRIGGENVHVQCHLHVLDPCHRRYIARRQRQKDVHVTEISGVSGGGEAPFQMINHLSRIAATPQ